MTLREYYNFPEGANLQMSSLPTWLLTKPNFPVPSFGNLFAEYKGTYLPILDTSEVTRMNSWFYNTNFSNFGFAVNWSTSKVTTIGEMFNGCSKLVCIDLSNWDVSQVTNMRSLFSGCSNLVSVDGVEKWDTSNVTTMNLMFGSCNNLCGKNGDIDLSSWTTSKVTDMSSMFSGCQYLKHIDMSNWDTSKVTAMSSMFRDCKSLTKLDAMDCSAVNAKNSYPLYMSSNYSKLTDVGGFIGMKMSWDDGYGLPRCPNLTRESCINILNGLYDFTGNGITPSSSQGKLKVHQNFLTAVGDDISIGTNKGWVITV
jgi:surface protein